MIRILLLLTAPDAQIDKTSGHPLRPMPTANAPAAQPAVPPLAPSASPGEPLVRFVGVQKTYDGVQLVVRQLDLDIRRGEFLTLLGP